MHEVDDLSLHEQGIPTWSSPYKIPPYICLMSSGMNDHICIWSLGDRAPNIHICMAKPKWGNTGRQVPCLHARTCNRLPMHACCCSPAATFGQAGPIYKQPVHPYEHAPPPPTTPHPHLPSYFSKKKCKSYGFVYSCA